MGNHARTQRPGRDVAGRFRHTWWGEFFSNLASSKTYQHRTRPACFVGEKGQARRSHRKTGWNLPPFEEGESESGGRPKKETAGTAATTRPYSASFSIWLTTHNILCSRFLFFNGKNNWKEKERKTVVG
ncbi:hypothetical protein DdX_00447 [Ditylenchus destructor]|uniref:Uncharacterized protein n=1 Tax=Ditylenchus destructor TaxID=166010 RepID=A0AAD4NGI9_9BILA|nr:hypothetical protein DdX_00447 [Ditylenchus destructor]